MATNHRTARDVLDQESGLIYADLCRVESKLIELSTSVGDALAYNEDLSRARVAVSAAVEALGKFRNDRF